MDSIALRKENDQTFCLPEDELRTEIRKANQSLWLSDYAMSKRQGCSMRV